MSRKGLPSLLEGLFAQTRVELERSGELEEEEWWVPDMPSEAEDEEDEE